MTAAPEQVARQEELTIRVKHEELDLLLFAFLQELIFFKDARRLLLHADRVQVSQQTGRYSLEAHVSGERIDAGRHRLLVDVKAVTLHRLQVECADRFWRAVVVLDV